MKLLDPPMISVYGNYFCFFNWDLSFFRLIFYLLMGLLIDASFDLELGEGRIRAAWGWISVDRGSKATLPLTMPRRVFKSSAKDSARRPCEIVIRGGRPRLVCRGDLADGTGPSGQSPYCGSGRTAGAGAGS